jgi:uncharacterized membrane protein
MSKGYIQNYQKYDNYTIEVLLLLAWILKLHASSLTKVCIESKSLSHFTYFGT